MTTQPHDPAYRVLKTVPLEEVPHGSLIRIEKKTGAFRVLVTHLSHAVVRTDENIFLYMQGGPDGAPLQIPVVYPLGTLADILVETLTEEPEGLGAVVAYHHHTPSTRPRYYTRSQWSGTDGYHWVLEGCRGTDGLSWYELQKALGYFTLVSPGYDPREED